MLHSCINVQKPICLWCKCLSGAWVLLEEQNYLGICWSIESPFLIYPGENDTIQDHGLRKRSKNRRLNIETIKQWTTALVYVTIKWKSLQRYRFLPLFSSTKKIIINAYFFCTDLFTSFKCLDTMMWPENVTREESQVF